MLPRDDAEWVEVLDPQRTPGYWTHGPVPPEHRRIVQTDVGPVIEVTRESLTIVGALFGRYRPWAPQEAFLARAQALVAKALAGHYRTALAEASLIAHLFREAR